MLVGSATEKEIISDQNHKPLSISRRLIIGLIQTSAIVAAISIAFIYLQAMQRQDRELNVKADEYLSYLIGTLGVPMWNLDTRTIKVIGETVSQNELIVQLRIIDHIGNSLYEIEKESGSDLITRSGTILHKGNTLGTVEFFLTKRFHQQASRNLLLIYCASFLVVILVLALVSGLLVRRFLKMPLKSLNDTVEAYSEGRYHFAAARSPYAEFSPFQEVLAKMGEKIQSQMNELRQAKEAAEAASIAKSKFLSNLSHELRTPLNPIMGYAQLIMTQKNITDEQKNQLQIVCDSCAHLTALISDMLELVRIDNQPDEFVCAAFNLHALVTGVVDDARKKALQKNIAVKCMAMETLPSVVSGDARMLRQVLTHLLDNAVKFTDAGTVSLDFSATKEEWPVDKWQLRFDVVDSGVGIPPDILDDVFLPFFQGDIEGRLVDGTGLGLTLSRRLVDLMGGRITIHSPCDNMAQRQGEGPGSKISVALEVDAVEADAQSADISMGDIRHDGSRPRQVLIVDDNPTNLKLLVHALEPTGYDLIKATNGSEALAVSARNPPDLILLDMLMPGMDGAEVLAHIRRNPDMAQVKVIGVSAAADGHGGLSTFVQACDDFIEKPVDISRLHEILEKHLGRY